MNVKHNDPAFAASHDDDAEITDKELGNDGAVDDEEVEETEEREEKETPAKEEESEEEEEEESEEEEEAEEEEEEEETDGEVAKLAKKLARAGKARERLEQKYREAQEKLQQYQQNQSAKSRAKTEEMLKELDELYDEVEEHRAAGRVKEASKAQRRIDELRSDMSRAQTVAAALYEAEKASETRLYNSMVAELETADPRFDKDSDEHDPELVEEVMELIEAFEARGHGASAALRKAVKAATREDPWSRATKKSIERKAEKRKTNVKKNIAAAKKQPPDEPGATKEKASSLPDMETISEEDFDKLPESVLQRILNEER